MGQLKSIVEQVKAASHLTSTDRSALLHDLDDVELPGIEALQSQARSAKTCAQVRAVAHTMVFSYRVYLVMTPQAHLTMVVDHETYIEGEMASLGPKIARAISAGQAQGKSIGSAESSSDDLAARLAAARSETGGLTTTLLQLAPGGYPTNEGVLLSARTSEANARNDLDAAIQDVKQIAGAVR